MGEHSFLKVFPYFFPLAVFTLRAIWYIRYILKIDLNLMTPDVVVWQLMDFLQQIRIPHPLPNTIGFFTVPNLGFGIAYSIRESENKQKVSVKKIQMGQLSALCGKLSICGACYCVI